MKWSVFAAGPHLVRIQLSEKSTNGPYRFCRDLHEKHSKQLSLLQENMRVGLTTDATAAWHGTGNSLDVEPFKSTQSSTW